MRRRKIMQKLFERILCPVDFNESSMRALDFARAVAEQSGGSICLLHVAALPISGTEIPPVPMDPYPVWEQTARAQLEKIAAEHLGNHVPYNIEARSGDASAGILNQADEMNADLIVMATHGRKGVAHLLLGSVAEQVIRQSTRPVLIFRPK